MSTPADHYAAAELLLAQMEGSSRGDAQVLVAAAQVHATLATVALPIAQAGAAIADRARSAGIG